MEYLDVLKLAGRLFDCADYKDLRGVYVSNLLIVNYEGRDFTGAMLYKCYPSSFSGALEIEPCTDEKQISLTGADLSGADLSGARLKGANLEYASLEGADLSNAFLQGADLEGADLVAANLQGTDLQGANLQGAKYNELTDFEGSSITKAQLYSMVYVEDEDGALQD